MAKKTQEELQQEKETLLKTYKVVHEVVVPLDNEDAANPDKQITVFFKKPDRSIRSLASKKMSDDYWTGIEVLIKALYIGGDDKSLILTNDDALVSCDGPLTKIMSVNQAVLKKN